MELCRRVCYNFDVIDLEKPVRKELRESIERELTE